ncbi:TraR/DksA C4-type zinc finger protein [Chitinophaga sancti]|uniref:TraR/DksA C4-type zinc finger protein n=1 Tax=Chitinophaga sancti TaxID=1004 RepID=A0A1K1NRP1_9BACT|nr:TraR/DksA C4-type zinc finger protein [Chitinophaga sancti]WQD60144.1 TraR/DksA C4-type zinc finger protein [Chitinophaga sancti]WQG87728.1 TraR/DksA C4-type zinc finger protein [Chitinophaga sancti]SFW38152.1 transcriptional regulator, TraR/DksA family [Chitinophaga sancti]
MATGKKVAISKTQKAAPATTKATVKQATPAKKAAHVPTAKKAAVQAEKSTAKTVTSKGAAKPATPVATQKAVASNKTVTKASPSSKSVAKQAPAEAVSAAKQPVSKATAPVKPAATKVPDTKQKVVAPDAPAEKEKLISKPEEKEVIMPVKNNKEKDEKEKAVAKDTGKKTAEKAPAKTEKAPVKAEKPAERVEKADKKAGSKANTLVTYQPEFTKSVLDQPEAPSGPIYRYSDADLQEFRDLISKKLEAAKKELVYLQGLITRKDEAGTDDTENKYMSMEDGSGSQEREQLNQMASRQIQFIDHLEKAMIRIENKTYGICRMTGKLIDKARLRAVPHATLSIEAKLAKSK